MQLNNVQYPQIKTKKKVRSKAITLLKPRSSCSNFETTSQNNNYVKIQKYEPIIISIKNSFECQINDSYGEEYLKFQNHIKPLQEKIKRVQKMFDKLDLHMTNNYVNIEKLTKNFKRMLNQCLIKFCGQSQRDIDQMEFEERLQQQCVDDIIQDQEQCVDEDEYFSQDRNEPEHNFEDVSTTSDEIQFAELIDREIKNNKNKKGDFQTKKK